MKTIKRLLALAMGRLGILLMMGLATQGLLSCESTTVSPSSSKTISKTANELEDDRPPEKPVKPGYEE